MYVVRVAVAVAFLTAVAFSQSSQIEAQFTQVKLFTPYTLGKLANGLQASSPTGGTCFSDSVADTSREDAWRCTAGNAIMDPCFQNLMGDPKVLACSRAPWETQVTALSLTSPLPDTEKKSTARDKAMPWALELANGDRCGLFTGATAPVAGMRINYGCPGGGQVVGDLDRSLPVWRVFYQKQGASALEQVGVRVAWY